MTTTEHDGLLAALRERAARRDWSGVRAIAETATLTPAVEFGLIVSEAELRQGETVQARDRLRQVIDLAARRHDPTALRRATNMLGVAYFELGDLPNAESAFDRALTEATRSDDHLTAARATNNLGAIANVRGHRETALALYRVALPAYQQLGFAAGMGETSHNIAITLRDLGQLDEADRYERRAIDFAADSNNARLAAMARVGRAEIGLRRGEAAIAAADARRAVAEYREMGDAMGEADALRVLGLARLESGEVGLAGSTIESALTLAKQSGATLIEAEALAAQTRWAVAASDLVTARASFRQATILLESLGAEADRLELRRWWEQQATA